MQISILESASGSSEFSPASVQPCLPGDSARRTPTPQPSEPLEHRPWLQKLASPQELQGVRMLRFGWQWNGPERKQTQTQGVD